MLCAVCLSIATGGGGGGRFDRQFHPMSVLSITIFPSEIRLFLGVFSADLLVITFGIM